MAEIQEAGHWLFQLANVFLALSYVSTDLLILRLVLMLAGLCFVLWGGLVLKVALDTVLWNASFCLINAHRSAQLIWARRPIKFERPEHEDIYSEVFGPVGIGRLQFKELVSHAFLRTLKPNSVFIEAGNEVSNLTIVYRGSMSITSAPKDGRPCEEVGTVERMQFVESPQWAGMQIARRRALRKSPSKVSQRMKSASAKDVTENGAARAIDIENGTQQMVTLENGNRQAVTPSEISVHSSLNNADVSPVIYDEDVKEAATVEVTFKAVGKVEFLMWPMERLQEHLRHNPGMVAPLNAIIGADVATKLFSQARGSSTATAKIVARVYVPLDELKPTTGLVPFRPPKTDIPSEGGGVDSAGEDDTLDSDGWGPGGGGGDELEPSNGFNRPRVADTRSPLEAEKVWLERRGACDTANDQTLASILARLTDLNVHEMSVLISCGKWRTIRRKGTILIREGEPVTHLRMVLTGCLVATKGEGTDARKLHTILPQQMVGSLEFNEPKREHIAGETVTALEPVTVMEWDVDDLRAILAPRPRLRAQLGTLISADLAAKFRQVEKTIDVWRAGEPTSKPSRKCER